MYYGLTKTWSVYTVKLKDLLWLDKDLVRIYSQAQGFIMAWQRLSPYSQAYTWPYYSLTNGKQLGRSQALGNNYRSTKSLSVSQFILIRSNTLTKSLANGVIEGDDKPDTLRDWGWRQAWHTTWLRVMTSLTHYVIFYFPILAWLQMLYIYILYILITCYINNSENANFTNR